jgi:hypothetical protein
MARLIDADAMRKEWLEQGENEFVYDANAVLDSIDAQPTADAVEVVRCRDCKWYQKGECRETGGLMDVKPDDFCSYGERRCEDDRPAEKTIPLH